MDMRIANSLVVVAALTAAWISALPAPAHASDAIYTNWRGRALSGYDPVAYFTEGRPVEGSAEFTTEWMGGEWRFASAANRARFLESPERYAPQYGGYCAWAMARGEAVSSDPQAWSIVGGKLYLNYSLSVQKQWEAARDESIRKADAQWPTVRAAR